MSALWFFLRWDGGDEDESDIIGGEIVSGRGKERVIVRRESN